MEDQKSNGELVHASSGVGIYRQRRRPILDIPSEIIQLVWREGAHSRVELARKLGVSPATTGDYVQRLAQAGILQFVENEEKIYAGRGRRPLVVDLNPQCGVVIALDVEGPRLKAARLDFLLTVETEAEFDIPARIAGEDLATLLIEAVEAMLPADGRSCLGIGIACPGKINHQQGSFFSEAEFGHLGHFNPREPLEARFKLPVHVENDMCCITLGEEMVGLGRGADYFLCLSARAGWVGAAVFLNGELAAGAQRGLRIGEWYLPVRPDRLPPEFREERDGDLVRCRLERLATPDGLLAIANHLRTRSNQEPLLSFEAFLDAVNRRERESLRTLETLAMATGRVLARIDDVLHFDKIVLNGLFLTLGPQFVDEIRRNFLSFRMVRDNGDEGGRVIGSALAERAGLIGAGGLAIKSWRPSNK